MKDNLKNKLFKFLGYFLVSQLLLIWTTPKGYYMLTLSMGLWYSYLMVNPVYWSKDIKASVRGLKDGSTAFRYLLPYDIGYLEPNQMAIQIIVNTILNVIITITLSLLLVYFGGF